MAEQSIEASMAVLRELYARPDGPRAVLEFLSQRILEEESREHVGAGWHERSDGRRGYRNGYKPSNAARAAGEHGTSGTAGAGLRGLPAEPVEPMAATRAGVVVRLCGDVLPGGKYAGGTGGAGDDVRRSGERHDR